MVPLIKRLTNFVLFGNIYVSLGAFFLVHSTVIQTNLPGDHWSYSILVFFASLFVYNFQRIFYRTDIEKHRASIRRKWLHSHPLQIRILAFIGLAGVGISMFFNSFVLVLYLSPLLFLSIAYFIPGIKLRKNPWVKLLTLVTVWTLVTALVPLLLAGYSLDNPFLWLHTTLRFLFMAGICLPFDIRDIEVDKADAVTTLPHVLSSKKTTLLATIVLLVYLAGLGFAYFLHMFNGVIFLTMLFTGLINTVIVALTNENRSEYFYVAGIDGTMIVQGALLMLVLIR